MRRWVFVVKATRLYAFGYSKGLINSRPGRHDSEPKFVRHGHFRSCFKSCYGNRKQCEVSKDSFFGKLGTPEASAEESIGAWNCFRKFLESCRAARMFDANFGHEKRRANLSSPLPKPAILRGLSQSDLVSGGAVYVEGVHLGGGLYQRSQ
jgi:hypothetical protein